VKLANHERKRDRRKLLFEALELRQMMAVGSVPANVTTGLNWLKANVKNVAIRTLAQSEFQDGVFSRDDMISIFQKVEQTSGVTQQEFNGLKAIVTHTAFFTTDYYVQQLAMDVVYANPANAHYLGGALGNLMAGAGSAKLEKLVDKWFLGTDHPIATSDWIGSNGKPMTFGYSQVAGQLFVQQAGDSSAVAYTDVRQGGIGDCYFLSSLAETALKDPSAITNMFIVNGDGTYTVRFMQGSVARYVTVDSKLPTDSYGELVFDGMGQMASNSGNELWVALAEKAYVQINESGWIRPTSWGGGRNVYNAISSGCMFMALNQITGQSTVYGLSTIYSTQVFNNFAAAFNAGDSVCLGSMDSPGNSQIVGDHAYAVLSVDTTNQTVTVYNPWGVNNGHDAGVITLSWYDVSQSFNYYDRTA
jgi:hypothetical protein